MDRTAGRPRPAGETRGKRRGATPCGAERALAGGRVRETRAESTRDGLVERAYGEIKRCILGNLYRPNAQFLEQDLAKGLGMSRTPVREAMIRLEREGLIEILPRRGMRVVPLAPEDMREIYEVLACLEAQAARCVAEHALAADELAQLEAALADMEAALAAGDLERWAAGDGHFHGLLLELCGNRRLAQLAFTMSDQVHRARLTTLHMRPLPVKSNAEHRAVVDAIKAGDGRAAYRLHRRHRERATRLITDILARANVEAL